MTRELRGGEPRLRTLAGSTFLLPTVVHCEDREHPLARREYIPAEAIKNEQVVRVRRFVFIVE